MSNVIPFSELSRQHKLHLLDHKRREFQERELYLNRLRKLLFQVEGQMRQAEMEQIELYHVIIDEFQLDVPFPNWGDRVGLQRLFKEHPALVTITRFLEDQLDAEGCFDRLTEMKKPADRTNP
ncbi:hypothetical protein [Desulfobacca acetoxidans]|uniref:Uncharacterized protein n=1 Tax=Desulfobacca acetoxidans (strain ATCC 700848 / DSM 11109 / ASRB2) TaxID=880072 RepID=F2NHT9_DESAR|nr:hypothetical protein [Desulfobacca acetoxidans]AEB09424.1 hypothetical protein Desac_1570 [Desulfobacca acetoxidans DSM 11109]HAY20839.1 hypothetical protein [Desulfobacterales bacterium]